MVIGWAYLSFIIYMIAFMVVLVVYLLISNCYLHYKVLDIEREMNVLSDKLLHLVIKEDKNK